MSHDLFHSLGEKGIANSERWFPALHDRGFEAVITHFALGIAGEAGEAVDVIKKWHREGGDSMSAAVLTQLGGELADLITYVCNLAWIVGIDLAAEWVAKQQVCEQRWGAAR